MSAVSERDFGGVQEREAALKDALQQGKLEQLPPAMVPINV